MHGLMWLRNVALVVLCALAFSRVVAEESGGAKGVPKTRVASITVATVRQATLPAVIEAQGAIAAWQEAVVSSRVSGIPLLDIRVNVGDQVRRGTLLARYDNRTILADVAQARASLAQAAASLHQATLNRDRVLSLKDSGAVSDQDTLQAVTQAETAVAQRDLAAASLKAQQVRLEDTRVLAPDDGVVSARSATLGQVPQAGTELFRMIRQGRLEWRAELTARQFSQVRAGMPVSLALPDGGTATGRVRQLAPALDATSRLGIAYVDLAPGGSARAAMYGGGRIEVGQSGALVVPSESVVIRDGRSYVFRIEGTKAQRVAVEVGRRQADLVEVVQGLSPNQRVAVRGAGFLAEGDTVQIVEPLAASSSSKG
jgi:RND family efflux transporter MFP subunit